MKRFRLAVVAITVLVLLFVLTSGSFLVIDEPQHADAIVVLAGETDSRPAYALDLLSQNYAPRIILDAESSIKIYDTPLTELAYRYVHQLPQKNSVTVCPIAGLSTKAETHDVATCLKPWNAHDILLVTSDYHTRRARSIFKHELPQYYFSVTAATDSRQFGTHWWKHRQWAKINFNEWLRLFWWEAVDRWI